MMYKLIALRVVVSSGPNVAELRFEVTQYRNVVSVLEKQLLITDKPVAIWLLCLAFEDN